MRERPFIGREPERAALAGALAAARCGQGMLVLLAGEAGVGKTRLAEEVLAEAGGRVLRGGAMQDGTPPYGPVVAALRAYLRGARAGPSVGDSLSAEGGPLMRHLALLLPELGPPPERTDRDTLFEAIHQAFAAIARREPLSVFLDDLHWSDSTTLELLPVLADALADVPLLVVAAYRSDELPRVHPLRRVRADLRRAGRCREIAVEPLDATATAALAAAVLGRSPSPEQAATLYERTQGVPFFVEELAAALAADNPPRSDAGSAARDDGAAGRVPPSVRDVVLLRVDSLSAPARAALEIAAVAGPRFDLDLVAALADGEGALAEPLELGLVVESGAGHAAFRHALLRDALYGELPWPRRRALHRECAVRLAARATPPAEVAEHWLAAREVEQARHALLAAADASQRVHAYRDAASAARRALGLWPDGVDAAGRLGALIRLGEATELCGELPEAEHVWREVAAAHEAAGDVRAVAEAQRRLATVLEVQGVGEAALAARQRAAAAFDACGLPGEAAAERLAAAEHLDVEVRLSGALDLVVSATREAAAAGRVDVQARALGLEGQIRAALGHKAEGLQAIQAGLALALDHDLAGAAAEVYYRLAVALEEASDYAAARDAYDAATDFCQGRGMRVMEQVCLGCLAVCLRQAGDWDRAVALCRDVIAAPEAARAPRAIAAGMLGSILALRGDGVRARPLLVESIAQARHIGIAALEIDSTWGLAIVDELDGAADRAAERIGLVIERWERTEDRHYAIPPLRWATTFFGIRGATAEARACARALARIAAGNANAEAIAGLAHALGECALLDGDARRAADHSRQALEQLSRLEAPLAKAHTQVRAGVALPAAGERATAVARSPTPTGSRASSARARSPSARPTS